MTFQEKNGSNLGASFSEKVLKILFLIETLFVVLQKPKPQSEYSE